MEFYRLICKKGADSHEPTAPIIIMNEDLKVFACFISN